MKSCTVALVAFVSLAHGTQLRSGSHESQEPDTACGKGFDNLIDGSKAYFGTAFEKLWSHPSHQMDKSTFKPAKLIAKRSACKDTPSFPHPGQHQPHPPTFANKQQATMGGGVSMPAAPVSASTEAALKKLYEEKSAAGEADDAINAALAAATPGIIVFNQIDVDGSGSIDTSELQRLLKRLPRNKPADGSPFVPFEELASTLGGDDAQISLLEWVDNLAKLPGLKAAVESNVDAATGKLSVYLSLEQRLEKVAADVVVLELNESRTDDENAELERKQADVSQMRARIGSGSIRVFEQIDADKSGKIERADLMKILGELPGDQEGEDNLPELIKALDVDGDGVIDMDEWIQQLEKIPLLKAQLDQYIDPATGLINPELVGPMKPPTAEATIPPADAPAE